MLPCAHQSVLGAQRLSKARLASVEGAVRAVDEPVGSATLGLLVWGLLVWGSMRGSV